MRKLLQSDNAFKIVKELYEHGVSYTNIANFLNDCGYKNEIHGQVTEHSVRRLCRQKGLRRQPGWNLETKNKNFRRKKWVSFLVKFGFAWASIIAGSYVYAWLVAR